MKSALVTGAAGGIGAALCTGFRRAGYFVVATDVFEPAFGDANIAMDLARLVDDPACRSKFLAAIRAALPGDELTVLVNNAALQIVSPVHELTPESFRSVLDVNVSAPYILSRAFLPELEAARGCIVNIASIHARLTKSGFSAYAASKAALVGLTQAMAVELGARIRVNAISPAAISTNMLKAGFDGQPAAYAALEAHHPAGRIGSPEEVASLAVFLASEEAGFINGANIGLDGAIAGRLHDPA